MRLTPRGLPRGGTIEGDASRCGAPDELKGSVGVVGWSVVLAVGMATVAAVLFALAAVAQNGAVAEVVRAPGAPGGPSEPVVGGRELRALVRSRVWVVGISLTAAASVLHAGALVLAPITLVQPVGVLSVPFAVVIVARRDRVRPPRGVVGAVVACLVAVGGFVALAETQMSSAPAPKFAGALAAALSAGAVAALLAWWGSRRSGWMRCVGFAAAGATAYGLVSALLRLVALHLSTGVDDLDDVGVWLPAIGIAAALLAGGWAVQNAHAAGTPAVVVGCLTVIDPLVAVALGVTILGEGRGTSPVAVVGLVGLAAVALSAAVFLARHYPAPTPAGR